VRGIGLVRPVAGEAIEEEFSAIACRRGEGDAAWALMMYMNTCDD